MPQRLDPLYRTALVAAWRAVRDQPLLWVLGVLTTVLGQCGFIMFLGRVWRVLVSGVTVADFWWMPQSASGLLDMSVPTALGSLALLGIACAGIILIVVASCIAQGALVYSALAYFRGKKRTTLTEAWHRGARSVRSIVIARFFEHGLLFALTVCMVGVLSVLPSQFLLFDIIRVAVIAGAVFIGMAISAVTLYTMAYSVDLSCDWHDAAGYAITLFSRHILVSFEVSGLVAACAVVVVIAVAIAMYVATAFGALFMLFGIAGADAFIARLGIMVASALFIVMVAVISGFFNAFVLYVWTCCFASMQRRAIPSRLAHFHHRLVSSAS